MANSKSPVNAFLDTLNNNFLLIMLIISVFVSGFLVGSYWKTNQLSKQLAQKPAAAVNPEAVQAPEKALDKTPKVTNTDHVQGAENPKVTLIEYSDFSCGYCAKVHPTLKQLVADYPNEVAWVYRHFLLSPTGPSRTIAEASECLAANNGNEAFWNFVNGYFEKLSTDSTLMNQDSLMSFVESLGYNKAEIEKCVTDKEFTQDIENDLAGGNAVGISGTPNIIIMSQDGEYELVPGAAPYEDFVEKIEKYL